MDKGGAGMVWCGKGRVKCWIEFGSGVFVRKGS